MKLLDWMQHKFRQTNNEPPTEFAPRNSCSCLAGQPSLDDLQFYPKSHHYAKAPSKSQKDMQFRKSFTCIETARVEGLQTEEEPAAAFSQLFHGFLAIGTLATETVTNEPATTFATYNMGQETEATENELKLVNDELEKMLGPEKPSEGTENNENGAVICPLQSYLFGSVIGLQETETVKKEKEHRTSLGDLFQRTKMVEQVNGAKSNKTEKQKEKETEKSVVHLMKKILKGRTLYSSTGPSTADKKPRKILQMFHKKVHPERLPVASESEDHPKYVTLGKLTEKYKNRNQRLSEDITIFPMEDTFKKGANCIMSYMPQSGCFMTDSHGYRECWIKSDAEYLVLELWKAKRRRGI